MAIALNPFKQSFINSLGTPAPSTPVANPANSQSSQTALTPGQFGVTSTTGATSPQPAVITPARKAFTASLSTPSPQPTAASTPALPPTPPSNTPITGNTTLSNGTVVNATTGAVTSAAPAPKVDNYNTAYQSYISSLAPSQEEQTATKNLNDLTLQAKKDQEEALNRGETLGFASGEAQRVNRNNAFATDAASNALNALTGSRQATTAQDKARLDYEQSLRGNTDPYTLSEGQVRYDAQGNKLAEGPAKTIAPVKRDTQVVNIGGQDVLVDTQTGARISTLGTAGKSVASANAGLNGLYTPGTSPAVDNWVNLIQSGQAKITSVPAALKTAVAGALTTTGNNPTTGGGDTTELGKKALTTAQELLTKFDAGTGTSAVGKSGVFDSFGYGLIPGTANSDFKVDFNALKSLLSLEGVKYLKGQGAVSDSERALLAQATSKLDLAQSEPEFRKSLQDIVNVLNGSNNTIQTSVTPISPKGSQSDKAFVEKTLTKQNLDYNHIVNSAPAGQIAVIENSSGQVGYVSPEEFKSSTYTRL